MCNFEYTQNIDKYHYFCFKTDVSVKIKSINIDNNIYFTMLLLHKIYESLLNN